MKNESFAGVNIVEKIEMRTPQVAALVDSLSITYQGEFSIK